MTLLLATAVFQVQATQTQVSNSLSLAKAIQRTFNNNPELQTFQYRFKAQQGRIIQADFSPRPEVELMIEDALGSGEYNGFDSAQTTLSIYWVFEGDIRKKRTKLAEHGKALVESELVIKRIDSATQTAHFFIKALSYQERIVIAKRAIGLAQATVKETKKRVKVGKTPIAELHRSDAELVKRKLVLTNLNYNLASSFRQLAVQWGSTNPDFNSVSGSLTKLPKLTDFQTLKAQIKHNPNLSRFLSQERINEAALKLAEEERNPKWQLTTGVRRHESSDGFSLVAGISIPLSISNRNQGRIAEARANISKNLAEADALRIGIETSLFILYQRLEHNILQTEIFKKQLIPKLEQALKEAHKAYELGKYSYFEWLAVQNELLGAQSELLDTSLSAHQNKIEIERLTGAQISPVF